MRRAMENRRRNATCKKCLDRGTVESETDFCDCEQGQSLRRSSVLRRQRMIDKKLHELGEEGVKAEVLQLRWFDARKDRDNIEGVKAIEALLDGERTGILLNGFTGVGKSFLATLAAVEFTHRTDEEAVKAHYLFVPDFVQRLVGMESSQLHAYYRAPLLVIDDLGKEPVTLRELKAMESDTDIPFSVAGIATLIDERERRRLPTIITSNFTALQISTRYRDYIAGRIYQLCGKPIQLAGDDRRFV